MRPTRGAPPLVPQTTLVVPWAVRDGSAAKTTGAKLGDKVIVFGASQATLVERTIERTRISKKKN